MITSRLFEVAFQEVLRATMRTSRATDAMEPEATADLAYRYAVAAEQRLNRSASREPPRASSGRVFCGHKACALFAIEDSDFCEDHQG